MTKVRGFVAIALGLLAGYVVWGALVLVLPAILGVYRIVPAAGALPQPTTLGSTSSTSRPTSGHP